MRQLVPALSEELAQVQTTSIRFSRLVSSTATAARTCRPLPAQTGSNTLLCKQRLQRAGASLFTFHLEAFGDDPDVEALNVGRRKPGVVQLAQRIRAAGMAVGLALKPCACEHSAPRPLPASV